jgi:tRNA (guanine10-N2)-methyltransferase
MELLANTSQDFGSWARKVRNLNHRATETDLFRQLITMRKTTDSAVAPERPLFPLGGWEEDHVPAHQGFRDKYFNSFGKREDLPPRD